MLLLEPTVAILQWAHLRAMTGQTGMMPLRAENCPHLSSQQEAEPRQPPQLFKRKRLHSAVPKTSPWHLSPKSQPSPARIPFQRPPFQPSPVLRTWSHRPASQRNTKAGTWGISPDKTCLQLSGAKRLGAWARPPAAPPTTPPRGTQVTSERFRVKSPKSANSTF